MTEISAVADKLGKLIHEYLYPLREGNRLDPVRMQEFRDRLEGMRSEIILPNDHVRADVASQLVEIYPLMLGCAPNHKDEGLIEDWAIDIQDSVLAVLVPHPGR